MKLSDLEDKVIIIAPAFAEHANISLEEAKEIVREELLKLEQDETF